MLPGHRLTMVVTLQNHSGIPTVFQVSEMLLGQGGGKDVGVHYCCFVQLQAPKTPSLWILYTWSLFPNPRYLRFFQKKPSRSARRVQGTKGGCKARSQRSLSSPPQRVQAQVTTTVATAQVRPPVTVPAPAPAAVAVAAAATATAAKVGSQVLWEVSEGEGGTNFGDRGMGGPPILIPDPQQPPPPPPARPPATTWVLTSVGQNLGARKFLLAKVRGTNFSPDVWLLKMLSFSWRIQK